MMRIAKEGLPFIGGSSLVLVLTYLTVPWISILPFLVTLFFLVFFRDPQRIPPATKGVFVAPADGKIIKIKREHSNSIDSDVIAISIFMSPLNVHINRMPCNAVVESVEHRSGGFKAAYTDDASLSNEQIVVVLSTEYGRIVLKQIAGFMARRAVCYVAPGDKVTTGQRYGMIKFGSRVDIELPVDVEVIVREGQMVKAGETILAAIRR